MPEALAKGSVPEPDAQKIVIAKIDYLGNPLIYSFTLFFHHRLSHPEHWTSAPASSSFQLPIHGLAMSALSPLSGFVSNSIPTSFESASFILESLNNICRPVAFKSTDSVLKINQTTFCIEFVSFKIENMTAELSNLFRLFLDNTCDILFR